MKPIGIFDSGIGGLSVYSSIKELLPREDYIYIADKKYFPYGTQDTQTIQNRGDAIISRLKEEGAKLVVIACNTSTVSALHHLRRLHPDIPIVGTVPVIKTCAEQTRTGRIGVLCTPKTAESNYQKGLISKFASDKNVEVAPCPNLVEEIESGKFKDGSEALIKPLNELLFKNIDTVALGCTHFPLVRREIENIARGRAKVLDSGEAIARQVKRVLRANAALSIDANRGETRFYTTKDSKNFDIMITRYTNLDVKSELLNI